MANTKISALNALTGANTAAGDLVPIVDISVPETKSITRDELKVALLTAPGSIAGVTIDSTANKPVTAASLAGGTLPGNFTTLSATGALTTATIKEVGSNVGIGTTGPGSRLEVVSAESIPMRITNPFAPDSERADFLYASNSTSNNTLRMGSIASSGGITFQGTAQNASVTKVPLVFNPDGGNVGIGTTTPLSRLTVAQSSDPSLGNEGTGGIRVYNASGASAIQLQVNASGAELSSTGTGTLLPLFLNVNRAATPPVTIAITGNVGIGTTGPATNLDVAGLIRAGGYTVATLPVGVVGALCYVTDQLTTAAAKGVAPTGGGAVVCYVIYNGIAWVGI